MNILVLTTLYPNAQMPSHGIFVENRLRAYQALTGATLHVIAPVPWVPIDHPALGDRARFAKVPTSEIRHNIPIDHPRYFIPPKIGMTYAAHSLAECFRKSIDQLLANGHHFDLIDAHYFYPDGVAAMNVADYFDLPAIITARGTDINLIPQYPRQKRMILDAAARAHTCITVADALRDEMIRLGAIPEKIVTLRNGVDLDQFTPIAPSTARAGLGLPIPEDASVIASVGHLIPRKGHDLVIRALTDKALTDYPALHLLIAGEGPEKQALEALAKELGVEERVHFLGHVPHDRLPTIYSAAASLVLASSREGWPNVLLEAMACGTACVATPIWGNVEVIRNKAAGRIATDRTPPALAIAIAQQLDTPDQRVETRHYAEHFSWDETAERLHKIFQSAVEEKKEQRTVICKPVILKKSPQPLAIVTVDTEERFDWSEFSHEHYTVCETDNLDRFQKICAGQNIDPVYFLTYPMITTQNTREFFHDLHTHAQAALGLHMHQWVNPPAADYSSPYYSFQKNLPRSVLKRKFQTLISAFEEAFGHYPTMHRAGRYGIAPENYDLLAELGVMFDFSPSARFDFTASGGSDFRHVSNLPFMVTNNRHDTTNRHDTAKGVSVLPVTGAIAYQHTTRFKQTAPSLGFEKPSGDKPFLTALTDTLPAKPMRLSPEGAGLDDLLAMTQHLIRENTPVLTFSFHSTTLSPGATQYTQSEEDVDRFLSVCDDYFQTFKTRFGGQFINASQWKKLIQ